MRVSRVCDGYCNILLKGQVSKYFVFFNSYSDVVPSNLPLVALTITNW